MLRIHDEGATRGVNPIMTWAGDTVTRVVERFYLGRVPASVDVTFAHQTALESTTSEPVHIP